MYLRSASTSQPKVFIASQQRVSQVNLQVSAYIATRTGLVVSERNRIFFLAEGERPAEIGPVNAGYVYLRTDASKRYVMWDVTPNDLGPMHRTLVYDAETKQVVFDQELNWSLGGSLERGVQDFGDSQVKLVYWADVESWGFATKVGQNLMTTNGQVLDESGRLVETKPAGTWSPEMTYRATYPRGAKPWQILDGESGADMTPEALFGVIKKPGFDGWLSKETFLVGDYSGTWRSGTRTLYVCAVAGDCQEAFQVKVSPGFGGLTYTDQVD